MAGNPANGDGRPRYGMRQPQAARTAEEQQPRPCLPGGLRQDPAGDLAGAVGLPGVPGRLRGGGDPLNAVNVIGAQLCSPQERGDRRRMTGP
jgi:hypothetical protein